MSDNPKLKDRVTLQTAGSLGENCREALRDFDVERYVADVDQLDGEPHFDDLELTQRTRRIALALHREIERSGAEERDRHAGLDLITKVIAAGPPTAVEDDDAAFWFWPIGDYLWVWGDTRCGARDVSVFMEACRQLTMRFTAEFAVRPVLASFPKAMKIVKRWALDDNEHVRRLASEGTRSRLPWASHLALPLDDVLAVLETLKSDPAKYVQRSVANHLNDLAKDHPDHIITLLQRWHAESAAGDGGDATRWIIRHAMRNQLKAGEPRVLEMFGYAPPVATIERLQVVPDAVQVGETVEVRFGVTSTAKATASPQRLMIDVVVGYMKANGSTSPKVFKFREVDLESGKSQECVKKLEMVHRSTRVLHAGRHDVTIRVNGHDLSSISFTLR